MPPKKFPTPLTEEKLNRTVTVRAALAAIEASSAYESHAYHRPGVPALESDIERMRVSLRTSVPGGVLAEAEAFIKKYTRKRFNTRLGKSEDYYMCYCWGLHHYEEHQAAFCNRLSVCDSRRGVYSLLMDLPKKVRELIYSVGQQHYDEPVPLDERTGPCWCLRLGNDCHCYDYDKFKELYAKREEVQALGGTLEIPYWLHNYKAEPVCEQASDAAPSASSSSRKRKYDIWVPSWMQDLDNQHRAYKTLCLVEKALAEQADA